MSMQRALASQERRLQADRLDKLGRSLLLALATVLSFGTFVLFAADQLYRPDTFVIDQLKIKGKFRNLQPAQIEAAVDQVGVGNFFSVDLVGIKQQVEALAWVQRAEVRREWPNTLLLEIAEHRPVMRWGKSKWVNSLGEVIELPGKVSLQNPVRLSGNPRDAKLMLQTAVLWKRRFAKSGLELRSIDLSESNAWTINLFHPAKAESFDLLLGRSQVEQRLARFEYLFVDQFQHSDLNLDRVDARYPDGLAIRAATRGTDDSNHDKFALQH